MNPSNRFAKLKLQEDELPNVGTFYNFMAASFPNIDEYLGLKPKKPFSHLAKSANSKTTKGGKRKFTVCPEASKKSKVGSFAGNSGIIPHNSLQSSENVNKIKLALDPIKKKPKGLVDYDSSEFDDIDISGMNPEEPYMSSPVTSTNLCATIKSEPFDDSCANMNVYPALKFAVKKELKIEPDEEDYDHTVSELMTMTKNVIVPYLDKELHISEVYSTFLELCRHNNVVDSKEGPTPTVVEWKFNLLHFLKCVLSKYNGIDESIIKNFTLTQCYNCFITLHAPKK